MTRRPIGSAALVIAGLLLFTGAPTRAAETADDAAVEKADGAKPLTLVTGKKTSQHKGIRARQTRVMTKASKKTAESKRAKAAESDKGLSPTVANANARMNSPDAHGEAAMSGAAPMEIAAADQFDELGRSLEMSPNDEPRRITTQLMSNDQPQSALPVMVPDPPRTAVLVRGVPSGDAWTQSSLIGKIFIAFGGVLTLASAARMLVA